MSEELILMIVGYVVSVLLEVVPGFKDWWSKVEHKRPVLFGLCMGVPVVIWLLICLAGLPIPIVVACTFMGFVDILAVGLAAFFGSQGGFVTFSQYTPNARARNGYGVEV